MKKRLAILTLAVALLLAFLLLMMVPDFRNAPMRAKAATTLNELRTLDGAKDQYALETGKKGFVMTPSWSDVAPYVYGGTPDADKRWRECGGKDSMGNPFIIGNLNERPRVHPKTKEALSDFAPNEFWGPYS